ncbi:MAG: hypothetical protein ACRDSR_27230 [Pseudonocardiaceae bacterium]
MAALDLVVVDLERGAGEVPAPRFVRIWVRVSVTTRSASSADVRSVTGNASPPEL